MPTLRKTLILLIIQVCILSCSSAVKLEYSEIEGRDVIIFVPGYKGSRLVSEQDGRTVWLSTSQLLFGGNSINSNSGQRLKADGILKEVKIIPSIYEIDIYRQCLDSLKQLGDYAVVEFGYDWRNSNSVTASRFKEFVSGLKKNGAKSISVIAHSMGGLSVAYALGYGEGLGLDKVAFLGTIFRGTMIAFLDMNRPLEPLPFNEKLYTRKEYISFDSAYEFLPHPEDANFNDFDQSNSKLIYDVNHWVKYSWGVFKSGKKTPEKINKLKNNLERSRSFFNSLDYITATCPNSEILNIQGIGKPVVDKYSFIDSKNGRFKKKNSMINSDGDGLITIASSALPKSLSVCPNRQERFEKVSHNRMCNDKRVLRYLKAYFKK